MKTWLISASLLIVGTILSFQNCSQQAFVGYSAEQKSEVLKQQVLACDGPECETEVVVNPETSGEDDIKMWPDEPTEYCGCDDDQDLKIKYFVSNWFSQYHSNVAKNTGFKILLQNKQDQTVCQFNVGSDFKAGVLNSQRKGFSWGMITANCPNLPEGSYRLRTFSADLNKDILSPKPVFTGCGNVVVNGVSMSCEQAIETPTYGSYVDRFQGLIIRRTGGKWYTNEPKPLLLIDNPGTPPDGPSLTLHIVPDQKASPLMIQLVDRNGKAERLEFSAVTKGILFDILGVNSKPNAHEAKRISWHKSTQYLYLALPDANGKVNGIDQLFGDNTQGSDGKFAKNGYLALRKYDTNRDGLITKQDEVFDKLRAWRDINHDGVAQSGELLKMHALGINLIDLNYDANFFEQDRHGNETRYKSVVQTDDGQIHLMFDIWFNYLDK